ncbi:TetR/AcrR family transcriptional regulator [Novosphingobium guangzhouense]|uniref:TetR family transcriptional regulator n=1 Tax=Novosphingobium guangzhouense TaxID=1850347 RepID=A0A2K2G6D4_9SPHN|nr:TetR/AcrR family transcriptional regulator [Novosphingobium guangzhouense]PNU06590.1 TetR family transcriptional regulator [Novosphingobium guangzhouense]
MTAIPPTKPNPTREDEVLAAAAALFAERGYAATSIRDIGERVGLLGGSLYHYIKSKDALFVRLHDAALQGAEDRIRAAIEGVDNPARRLAMACRVLLAIQLDPESLTMPLMNDLRAVPEGVRAQLIQRRDAFERLFSQLVDALPPHPGRDPAIYRILLLTTLNSAGAWYRPGRLGVEAIADQILALYGIDG